MIRMAWHCSGTYRTSDGEGGCGGGRQRFEPERSWIDNANLDKAETLMQPIKDKYGLGLSWGDLMVLIGTVALEEMGTPSLGFCAGRIDDEDGSESYVLGTTPEQEELTPCPQDGNCTSPFGAALLDHIYVDAGGFLGEPDPVKSVGSIRDVFARMGMNDTETVALIGGGHTFGKAHGACPGGPGVSPVEAEDGNGWPFPNTCGANPSDITTSGFEGPWSSQPLNWTQNYFTSLLNNVWTLNQSVSGNNQYASETAPFAPSADSTLEEALGLDSTNYTDPTMMLVTDISMISDDSYSGIVSEFATDMSSLDLQFASAWYKLVTRDMGPSTRCFNEDSPDAQYFQGPLPQPFTTLPELDIIDEALGEVFFELAIIETAYLCAATYRASDFFGGCNGGRIRLEPEKSWPERIPVEQLVNGVHEIELNMSTADKIVYSATKALQMSLSEAWNDSVSFTFCPYRSDAVDEYQVVSESLILQPYDNKALQQKRHARLLGLSLIEYVALQGRPRTVEYMNFLGYSGSYTTELTLSNSFTKALLQENWNATGVTGIYGDEYVLDEMYLTAYDMALINDTDFLSVVEELANNDELFFSTFTTAWTKLMNSDRFDGPVENLCTNGNIEIIKFGSETSASGESDRTSSFAGGVYFGVFFASLLFIVVLLAIIGGALYFVSK